MREARRQDRGDRAEAELGGKLRQYRQDRGRQVRPRRHPGGRFRPQQGGEDRRAEARGFPRRDGRQCHPILADGARRRRADAQAGRRRQGDPHLVRRAGCSAIPPAIPPIAPRSRRSTASPRRSAANGARAASPSMRWGRPCSARRSPPGCTKTPSGRRPCARASSPACPKGRLGEPEDLAGPLLFLASKASDFYTGHILYADGGYTAG